MSQTSEKLAFSICRFLLEATLFFYKENSMKNESIIQQQEKYFKAYTHLPIILGLIIFLSMFIFGIVDACTIRSLGINSGFLCWFIWFIIGIVAAFIELILCKILLSQKVLTVLYLQKLNEEKFLINENFKKLEKDSTKNTNAVKEEQKEIQILNQNYKIDLTPKFEYALNADAKSYSISLTNSNRHKFEEILIPSMYANKPVTKINNNAFSNMKNLKQIILPDSISYIGSNAFFACNSLININIPTSISTICNQAFHLCSSIKSIYIPKNVTTIGGYVFGFCTSLTIFCEAKEKPEGWNINWNPSNCPVIWGYKSEE